MAIKSLFANRALCNNDIIPNHPTVQVRDDSGRYTLGVLGLLNGLLPVDAEGNGSLVAVYDYDSGDILKFCLWEERPESRRS